MGIKDSKDYSVLALKRQLIKRIKERAVKKEIELIKLKIKESLSLLKHKGNCINSYTMCRLCPCYLVSSCLSFNKGDRATLELAKRYLKHHYNTIIKYNLKWGVSNVK